MFAESGFLSAPRYRKSSQTCNGDWKVRKSSNRCGWKILFVDTADGQRVVAENDRRLIGCCCNEGSGDSGLLVLTRITRKIFIQRRFAAVECHAIMTSIERFYMYLNGHFKLFDGRDSGARQL